MHKSIQEYFVGNSVTAATHGIHLWYACGRCIKQHCSRGHG